MKRKGLHLILVLLLVLGVSVTGFAASNPFADVPADHWAYDAIIQLAAVGLIEGYPDGTYGGSRMLTRYEAAMVFARTLARLEALVDAEVSESVVGMQGKITSEVLASIEAAKASLVDLIKAELAAIEIPVVEHHVVETRYETVREIETVVEKPIEIIHEITNEITNEITRVEVVEKQTIEVERPFQVTAEVDAIIRSLVAAQIQELLKDVELEAKEIVHETTIIERIVEVQPSLTAKDVEWIAEELLSYVLSDYDVGIDQALRENARQNRRIDALEQNILNRFRGIERNIQSLEGDIAYVEHRMFGLIEGVRNNISALEKSLEAQVAEVHEALVGLGEELQLELALLGIRIDSLEFMYDYLDGRLTELEDDYAVFKAETERIKLSGSLALGVTDTSGTLSRVIGSGFTKTAEPVFTQDLGLNYAIRASDTVNVNMFLNGRSDASLSNFNLTRYGIEVRSQSPIKRMVAGTLSSPEVGARFTSYVLAPGARPGLGVLIDADFAGMSWHMVAGKSVLGATAKLELSELIGLKVAYAVDTTADAFADHPSRVLAGAYGKLLTLSYDAVYALNLAETDENSLMELKLNTDVGPVKLDLTWATAGSKFANAGFVQASDTRINFGASTTFAGLSLNARVHTEQLAGNQTVMATRFAGAYNVHFVLPFEFSAVMAKAESAGVTQDHTELKVAVRNVDLFNTGVKMGASFTNVQNRLPFAWSDWRNVAAYSGVNANIIGANLGYKFNLKNATLGLDYGISYALIEDKNNEITHTVGAAYDFATNLKLSVSAESFTKLAHLLGETNQTVNQVKAGVEFRF